MNTLEQKLVEYGLHEYEARLYLAGMELGPSPVQKIAKQAEINRVSAYNFIRTLIDKGLMSTFEDGKRTMYVASAPDNLVNLFEYQKRELDDKKKDLERLLPEFRSKYNVAEGKPVVRYYEGQDGVVAMNDEFFSAAGDELFTAYDYDIAQKYFTDDLRKRLRVNRVERGIGIKILYTAKEKEIPELPLGERYKIEDPSLNLSADLAIFADRVRFISFSEKTAGILIEDKQIAQTLKCIFSLACKAVEKNKK